MYEYDNAYAFIALDKAQNLAGLGDGKVGLKGLFDGGAAGLDAIAAPLVGGPDVTLTVAQAGVGTVGNPCMIANAQADLYETTTPVADVVSASMNFQVDGGIDRGVILAGLRATAFTQTDITAGSVDNAAASANGCLAAAHVTAYTLTTGTVTVKVQHSVDNTTFTDLVTVITTAAALASGTAVVAPGTTVNRYLRASIATTGSAGSVTTTLSFARR